MVAPGLSGIETTMELHNAHLIGDPNSTWGKTEGNPIHDAIRNVAEQSKVDFSIDVTTNRDHEITSVYAGNLFDVHRAACQTARSRAMMPVKSPFDIVLTTNSGYPLDLNLYQSIKGISAAAQIVRTGGIIICAAECRDGVPDHGEYGKILTEKESPAALLEMINNPEFKRHDQWQVQIQAAIQLYSDVYLKSDNLSDKQIVESHLIPTHDVSSKVSELLKDKYLDGTVCVLPEGPQTIPYLSI